MKSYFRHKLVNGPFEDPCLMIGITRQKRVLLFDLGDVHNLSQTELNKVSDVFVTHMHIDHFIGFDTLLRAILRRPQPLRVFGPEGITDCVWGKLKGYTWNLISGYPLKIEVYEVSGRFIRHSSFYAEKGLMPHEKKTREFNGILLEEPFFRVKGLLLTHGIPVLAYRIDEEVHINIDKDLLKKKGLEVGPWLSEYKEALIKGDQERLIDTGKGNFRVKELKDIAIFTEGQKISYLMDLAIENDNIERVTDFVKGSDYLYTEAYYLHKDIKLAVERNHLTARIAGSIARKAEVKNLIPLHFSLRYKDHPELIIEEAMKAFSGEYEEE
jgi:ribonuclease Z